MLKKKFDVTNQLTVGQIEEVIKPIKKETHRTEKGSKKVTTRGTYVREEGNSPEDVQKVQLNILCEIPN